MPPTDLCHPRICGGGDGGGDGGGGGGGRVCIVGRFNNGIIKSRLAAVLKKWTEQEEEEEEGGGRGEEGGGSVWEEGNKTLSTHVSRALIVFKLCIRNVRLRDIAEPCDAVDPEVVVSNLFTTILSTTSPHLP